MATLRRRRREARVKSEKRERQQADKASEIGLPDPEIQELIRDEVGRFKRRGKSLSSEERAARNQLLKDCRRFLACKTELELLAAMRVAGVVVGSKLFRAVRAVWPSQH